MKKLTPEQARAIKERSRELVEQYMRERGYQDLNVIGDPVAETELLMSFSRAFRETIDELTAKPRCEGCEHWRYEIAIREGEVEQRSWKVCWHPDFLMARTVRWAEK